VDVLSVFFFKNVANILFLCKFRFYHPHAFFYLKAFITKALFTVEVNFFYVQLCLTPQEIREYKVRDESYRAGRMVVYSELNLYVGLVGAAVVLLPFFFISFMFKIGKFATPFSNCTNFSFIFLFSHTGSCLFKFHNECTLL
jgi:hypothetical protein